MLVQGKVAVISGGGAGIGQATATAYSEHGARVAVVDIDGEAAVATAAAITAAGGAATAFEADASAPTALERLFDDIADQFGHVDVLHNNHVWFENGNVEAVSLDGFRRSLDVGLVSYMYAIKLAIPLMPAGGGAIVNTASVCGLGGDFGLTAYNVLKAGVVNLSRSVALDYARRNIRCNAICPGPTLTAPYRQLQAERPELLAATCNAVPMGRFGDPSEIAAAAVFLASDLASYVTGTTLVVDGGLSAWTGLPPLPSGE